MQRAARRCSDAQLLVGAVQLVHERDAAHAELRALALRQLAQRGVEGARSEEEAGVQHLAVAQLAPETLGEARPAAGIAQVGLDPRPAAGADAAGAYSTSSRNTP